MTLLWTDNKCFWRNTNYPLAKRRMSWICGDYDSALCDSPKKVHFIPFSERKGNTEVNSWKKFVCLSYPIRKQHVLYPLPWVFKGRVLVGPWVIEVGESESGYKSGSKVKKTSILETHNSDQWWLELSWTLRFRGQGVWIWVIHEVKGKKNIDFRYS